MPEKVPDLTSPVPVATTYTSRPVSITAIQWTGDNVEDLIAWVGADPDGNPAIDRWWDEPNKRIGLWVQANFGWLGVSVGEWIIKDSEGFYPCKDSVFQAKYRPGAGDTANMIIPPELRRHLESQFEGPIHVAPRSLDMTMVNTHPLDITADGGSHKPGVEIRNIVLVTKADTDG